MFFVKKFGLEIKNLKSGMIEKDKYRVVNRLLEQKIVTIFQGQSEYIELGNRSILTETKMQKRL